MSRFFPRKLHRVQYFCYTLCLIILVGVFTGISSPLVARYYPDQLNVGSIQSLVLMTIFNGLNVGVLIFKLLMLDVPRIRSIGWSSWVVLLMLIPFLNVLVQLLLFLLPANFFVKDDSLDEVLQNIKSRQSKENNS